MNGVFEDLIERRAFFDRVEVSVTDFDAQSKIRHGRVLKNQGCKGPRGFYARCALGTLDGSQNPFKLLYGKASRFRNVPDARLTFHSERVPLTASQLLSVIHDVSRAPSRCRVTYAEMTFDLRHVTFDETRLQLFSPATRRLQLSDDAGRRTLYIGGPRSDRQIRVYEKTKCLLRIEIIFRRACLKRMGIASPHELLCLSSLDLSPILSFRILDQEIFSNFIRESWRRRLWLCDPEGLRSYQSITVELARELDVDCNHMLKDSILNSLMAEMRGRLLW